MRNAIALAVASWMLSAAAAQATSQPATLSDELLRLWNQDDETVTHDTTNPATGSYEDGWFESEPAPRKGQFLDTPAAGKSLTPNLDRLLRQHTPIGVDAENRVARPHMEPFTSTSFKGGSGPTTDGRRRRDDDDRRWCRNPCRHRPVCGYIPPPPPPDDCDPPKPVPEPATMLLFGAAAATAAGVRRRRNKNRSSR